MTRLGESTVRCAATVVRLEVSNQKLFSRLNAYPGSVTRVEPMHSPPARARR